jgi:DNA-binding HxlR family transcriptional regulator
VNAKITDPDGPSLRRYGQYCPVARSLDVLGERWTLLIVRNLLMGPQRYTDLREGLPGIATDLLTARLRTLEEAGYVQRRKLPRPAPATVYELTDSGRQIGRVVIELARLGIERLGPPTADENIRPSAVVLSFRASFHPDADDSDAIYQLELDGEPFTVTIRDQRITTARGHAELPRCTITTGARTLAQLLSGVSDPETAITTGELRLTGDRTELNRFLATFAYPASPGGTELERR